MSQRLRQLHLRKWRRARHSPRASHDVAVDQSEADFVAGPQDDHLGPTGDRPAGSARHLRRRGRRAVAARYRQPLTGRLLQDDWARRTHAKLRSRALRDLIDPERDAGPIERSNDRSLPDAGALEHVHRSRPPQQKGRRSCRRPPQGWQPGRRRPASSAARGDSPGRARTRRRPRGRRTRSHRSERRSSRLPGRSRRRRGPICPARRAGRLHARARTRVGRVRPEQRVPGAGFGAGRMHRRKARSS